MKALLTYKSILTMLILLTVWCIIFVFGYFVSLSVNKDRYQIKTARSETFLLDTKTGAVWRNVWNNERDKIPCNWELMSYDLAPTKIERYLNPRSIWDQAILIEDDKK